MLAWSTFEQSLNEDVDMADIITTAEAKTRLEPLLNIFSNEIIAEWPIVRGASDGLSERDLH